jgi:carbon-monoxide dehydrogenase medium subunit
MGYARAATLDDLWALQDEAGPDAQILAGGQSLLATLSFRLSEPSVLIDITRIAALKGIVRHGDRLRIGALTRHAEIGRSAEVARYAPMFAQAVPLIAHPAIRNRGTIGGSIALADPAAEWPACAVALGADIIVVSKAGERRVPAEIFFRGLFETALEPGDIVAAIELPCAGATSRQTIAEVTRRSGDYAMAGLAAALEVDDDGAVLLARLVYFGVGSQPVLARRAGSALVGRPLSQAAISVAQAALADDLDPSADLHGGPDFKRHLARVLTARALTPLLAASEQAA